MQVTAQSADSFCVRSYFASCGLARGRAPLRIGPYKHFHFNPTTDHAWRAFEAGVLARSGIADEVRDAHAAAAADCLDDASTRLDILCEVGLVIKQTP